MFNFEDFADGTAFIVLMESDFVNKERFAQYVNFMKQNGAKKIEIPIDSKRARKITNRKVKTDEQ